MTALFSTAETFTASSALGALLTNAPAELAVLALTEPRAGKAAPVNAILAAAAVIAPAAGAFAAWPATEMIADAQMTPAGGGMASLDLQDFGFDLTPFVASAGGMAALVTDVVVIDYPPTAAFSTATLEWVERLIRVPHELNFAHDLVALSGVAAEVDAQIQTVPDDHGPVVRSRAVQGLIVMS